MNLAAYLGKRGTCPALTRLEADTFGVPYPLVAGWPDRYAAVEITPAMIDQLRASIEAANKSTAAKARRALDGALGLPVAAVTREPRVPHASATRQSGVTVAPAPRRPSMFPGFVVRPRGTAGVPWKV